MATAKKPKSNLAKLNWEYCECGCHQHVASVGSKHYSIFSEVSGPISQMKLGPHHAYRNHRGERLGTFETFAEADAFCFNDAKEEARSVLKALGIAIPKSLR